MTGLLFQSHIVIGRCHQILLRPEITLSRSDRTMAQQKLDLRR
jgi:hypothetical protein